MHRARAALAALSILVAFSVLPGAWAETTNSITTKGATPKGTPAKGTATKGTPAKGTATKGTATKGTKAETAKSARRAGDPACDRANFRVVVDVGHSAKVPGARSARGATEYEYNLRLGTQIAQALRDGGFAKTTLLVSDDPPRSGLFKRVERANGLKADLFLSIHHDSVPNQFLEKWEFEGQAHGFSDRFKGHSIFISNDNGDRQGSLLFGQLLGRELRSRGLQHTPHYVEPFMGYRRREMVDAAVGVYRYDQLIVLRHTQMPAVLLEAGSIINRHEELELRTAERRTRTTESTVEAIAAFCAVRSQGVARAGATPTAARAAPAMAAPATTSRAAPPPAAAAKPAPPRAVWPREP